MRGSITTLVLFAIIGGLLLLLLHQNVGGGEPLSNGDIASLIAKIGFLILISGAVLRLLRDRFSDALRQAMIWVIFGLMLVVVYTFRYDLRDTGDRVLAELIPGHVAAHGEVVEVARGRGGDFQIGTEVNGVRVPMVLDTGASSVVLTHDAAVAAGLPVEMIHYTVSVDTANGRAQAAPGDARPHRGRLDRGAPGPRADRPARPVAHQPARHELSLAPAGLGGARRQGDDARGKLRMAEASPRRSTTNDFRSVAPMR